MNIALHEPWTLARFLAWEDKQEGRFEFDGTQIVEVTGASRGHQRIVSNLVRLLEDILNADRFDVAPEMRLQVGNRIRYPDVSVVPGQVPASVRTLLDAIVLFEVTSPDSAAIDREQKPDEYAALPSIRSTVILEQTKPEATVLSRAPDGWDEQTVTDALQLPAIGVTLPLASIYRGVRFD